MKADSSGFAADGGTEAVTHFGLYDDTALFFGGDDDRSAVPVINNPGEFDLKTPPV